MLFARRNGNSVPLAAVLTGLLYAAAAALVCTGTFTVYGQPAAINYGTSVSLHLAAKAESPPSFSDERRQSAAAQDIERQNASKTPTAAQSPEPAQKDSPVQVVQQLQVTQQVQTAEKAAIGSKANQPQTKPLAAANDAAAGSQTSGKNGTGQGGKGDEAGGSRTAAQRAFLNELDQKIRQNLVYPERARKSGTEGDVRILINISAAGRLENCVITESSGSPVLDGAALALLKSIFPLTAAPAEPFESRISITYRLE